jgi:hypothetical protein
VNLYDNPIDDLRAIRPFQRNWADREFCHILASQMGYTIICNASDFVTIDSGRVKSSSSYRSSEEFSV